MFLGAERVAGMCQYHLSLEVPDAPPGTYNVVVFEVGGGAAMMGQPVEFTVTG